jgi:hypothetical protein
MIIAKVGGKFGLSVDTLTQKVFAGGKHKILRHRTNLRRE